MALMTGNEFKCLQLVIRKTRGWSKEFDAISTSQFVEFTGIKRQKTIYAALHTLVEQGWLICEKRQGRVTRYGLSNLFNQWHLSPVAETATGGGKCPEPVAETATATSGGKCHPTKPTIQNPNTKGGACDLFIKTYPQQVKEKQIREEWTELNKQLNLDEQIDMIIADIQHRKKSDRKWKAGYSPDPLNYLKGARWNDAIDPVKSSDKEKPDWAKIPFHEHELLPFAKKHGYPSSGTMTTPQYRNFLKAQIDARLNQ